MRLRMRLRTHRRVAGLTIADASAAEADGVVRFTVSLSVASGAPVTVAYQTGDGRAKAGADYEAASGRLTFAAESTVAQQIEVRLRASLEVTGGGTMYPPFDADILHYALTCSGSSTLGVAAQTERAGAQLTLLRADAADNEASTTGTLNASVTVGGDHDVAIEVSDDGQTRMRLRTHRRVAGSRRWPLFGRAQAGSESCRLLIR